MTERFKKSDLAPADRPRTSPVEDILELDARLIATLARRLRATQRAAKGRQVLDRETEKRLWSAFDQAARQQNLDPRLSRQLFALISGFGLEVSEGRRAADKPFTLVPRSESADVDIKGPASLSHTRLLAVLAAASGSPMHLDGVVLNDPLVELIKALNQAGAHLSWSGERLESAPAQSSPRAKDAGDFPLRFEDVLVFAGEEPFTLYALLALALREAGRSKFAGGPNLKLLDLRPLDALLPHLGARLAPMNPRSRGLPARLESGGRMAARLELLPETPPLFAQALALAAWSYPEGLRLVLSVDPVAAAAQALALDEALEVLVQCRVAAERQGSEYVIPACRARVPLTPALPLDPVLSAYLLAIPAVAGGTTRLSGQLTLAAPVLADLQALGLSLEISRDSAFLRNAQLTPGARLGMGRQAEYLPLALALAVQAKEATVDLPLESVGQDTARALAVELLGRLGAAFEEQDGAVKVLAAPSAAGKSAWSGIWTSPDPYVSLGLALMSFQTPGIAIDNPGGLATLWPRFWTLYNSLPIVRDLPAAPREKNEQHVPPKPRKQRVRV